MQIGLKTQILSQAPGMFLFIYSTNNYIKMKLLASNVDDICYIYVYYFVYLQCFLTIMRMCKFIFCVWCTYVIPNQETPSALILSVILHANIIMVNQRISSDLKECALTLWDRGWDYKDISDAFFVSVNSLYHWWKALKFMVLSPSYLCSFSDSI